MEGHRYRAALRAPAAALALSAAMGMALGAERAGADGYRRRTTDAASDRGGVSFSIAQVQSSSGSLTSVTAGVTCTYEVQFGNIGSSSDYWEHSGSTETLARKTCSDGSVEFVWVDVAPSVPAPTVDPARLARRVRDRLAVPQLALGASPAARGLVGLPSRFWVRGGVGSLGDSLAAFGTRVEVRVVPRTLSWDFGDGIVLTVDPLRSEHGRGRVRHTFERSSAGRASGYAVSATAEYTVRWRSAAGPWRSLEPIVRTSAITYPVVESQALLSGG